MAFDAGTIQARIEIEQSGFDRDLNRAEERVRQFERTPHRIRLTAVFDESSLSKARRQFTMLDQQISRDAAQRMKAGGTGSVLGALNSLFSTQQVAGAPTPQQASQQGLLGRIIKVPGGGGGGGGSVLGSLIGSMLGSRSGSAATAREEEKLQRSLLTRLGLAGIGGGGGNQGLGTGLFKGIGPGILGIGTRASTIIGLGAAGLGALPAAAGPLAALGVAGAGAGVISAGAHLLIGTKQDPGQLYKPAQDALAKIQAIMKSAAQPLVAPLRQAFGEIPKLLHGIEPLLRGVFAGAATLIQPFLRSITPLAHDILPGLAQAFRATAPLIQPLIGGLGRLAAGILPGLVALLRASRPAVAAFAQVLGTIGRDLGSMLKDFAPVIRSSSVILKALADVLAAILPLVGKLAALFARSLAPVVKILAGAIRDILPVVTILARIFAQFAGAVLADLAAAFQAVAILLKDITPSLRILAGVLGQVFKTMENAGVFAILGDALEATARPLARLINALVRGLAPFLPVIFRLISSLATIAIRLLAGAIAQLVPVAIQLVNDILKPLLPVVISLVPVITQLARLFAAGLATALVAILKVATPILTWIIHVAAAIINWLQKTHLLVPVLVALIAILDPIPTAIAAIGIAIGYLATHWHQIWNNIKNWAQDAWNFITHGWGQWLVPGLTLIRLAVGYLRDHWRSIWNDIKRIAQDLWQWLWTDFGQKIVNFFTKTIPGWWQSFRNTTQTIFNGVKNDIGNIWDTIWRNTVTRVQNGISDVIGFFKGLPGKALNALRGLGHSLYSFAHSALMDLLHGAESVGKTIINWFKNLGLSIWHGIEHVLNMSPPHPGSVFWELGKNIIHHMLGGLNSMAGDVAAMGGNIAGKLTGAFTGSALAIGKAMAARLGWTGAQWRALVALWNRESGWRWNATNPTSGAYGIPQALPASKMASAGSDWRTNPATQIRWGLGYIAGRYGTPLNALAHENRVGWYRRGGLIGEPVLGIGLRTGAGYGMGEAGPEYLAGSDLLGEVRGLRSDTRALIAEVRASGGRTGVAMGAVLQGTARGAAARRYAAGLSR